MEEEKKTPEREEEQALPVQELPTDIPAEVRQMSASPTSRALKLNGGMGVPSSVVAKLSPLRVTGFELTLVMTILKEIS